MVLTPVQVRGVVFSKPPIGKPGYHEDEVDAFLDAVEAELARLLEQHTNLRHQLQRYDQQPGPDASDTSAASSAPLSAPIQQPPPANEDAYHHHAARVLTLAQQTADRVTNHAHTNADALLNQAHTHAEQLLREAQSTAQGLISEAATRAETIVCDARTRADTLEQESTDEINKITLQQQEKLRQHTKIITALSADKTALENKIQHLRVFEDDYRTRLTRFLHAQLQQLDPQKPAEPAHPINTQQAPVTTRSDMHPQTSPPWSFSEKRRWTPAVGT